MALLAVEPSQRAHVYKSDHHRPSTLQTPLQTPATGVEDEVPDDLPPNEYYEYFKPDYRLHLTVRVVCVWVVCVVCLCVGGVGEG